MPSPSPLRRALRSLAVQQLRAQQDPDPLRPPALVGAQAALGDRLRGIDARLSALQASQARIIGRLDRRRAPFSLEMTVEEALARHPGAQGVLAARHLPHCGGCAVRFDESLAEVADAYGLSLEDLLQDLNRLLAAPPFTKA